MDKLKAKVGPLPVWGWGLAVMAVAAGYFYMRRGSGGDSGGTTPLDYGSYPAVTDAQGYDAGYAAGLNATGTTPPGGSTTDTGGNGTTPPMPHGQTCFITKNPAGHKERVCVPGYHWQHTPGKGWSVVPGTANAPGGGQAVGLPVRTVQTPRAGSGPVRRPGSKAIVGYDALPTGAPVNYATV